MADTTTQTIAIPIGPKGELVQGTLITNKNGDAEWYAGIGLGRQTTPTFTSNANNDYKWQPSSNCLDGVSCPTQDQKELFYTNTNSIDPLNQARLATFNSPSGFNSPQLAKQLKVPGSNTAPAPPPFNPSASFSRSVKDPLPNPEIQGTASADFSNETMIYPVNLSKSTQDYLQITAIEYKARTLGTNGQFDFKKINQGFNPRNESITRGTCYLPIQPVILDQNIVNWGPENMGAFEALFAQGSFHAARGQGGSTQTGAMDYASALGILGGDPNVQNALRLYFAGRAVGNQSFFTRITGAIVNPNLELLFNGPSLRVFNYSFRLSPRNTQEAKSVRTIIRFFKEMSAVRTANNALFLKSPNVFKIKYFKGGSEGDHKSLHRIKTCALTSMTVNYTPDNSYMTFTDDEATMTSYDMALTFQELEPVYDKDYQTLADKSEIGF